MKAIETAMDQGRWLGGHGRLATGGKGWLSVSWHASKLIISTQISFRFGVVLVSLFGDSRASVCAIQLRFSNS